MNERTSLLRSIQAVGVVMFDLHLYLNTHPHDQTALALFYKYRNKYSALVASYERMYGPLTAGSDENTTHWQWISDPWPWEYSANAEA